MMTSTTALARQTYKTCDVVVGRVVASCYADGQDIAAVMVRAGLAFGGVGGSADKEV